MVTQHLLNIVKSANQSDLDKPRSAQSHRSGRSNHTGSRPSTCRSGASQGRRGQHSGAPRCKSVQPDHTSTNLPDIAPGSRPERRLSRTLTAWLPEYDVHVLMPDGPRVPTYSARLGGFLNKETRRRPRPDSPDSDSTLISLLSCSSGGAHDPSSTRRMRRRKRRPIGDVPDGDGSEILGPSIWVRLANKSKNVVAALAKMNTQLFMAHMDSETEIFNHLPEEEQEMVIRAGREKGIHLGPGSERSDSASRVDKHASDYRRRPRQRTQSTDGTHEGPMINFREIWKKRVKQQLEQLALMQQKSTTLQKHLGPGGRRGRSSMRMSMISTVSSRSQEGGDLSPLEMQEEEEEDDAFVLVWAGDAQILAIDLQRELTDKVKSKIDDTTVELEKVTGMGDDNESRQYHGPLPEYPGMVQEDYSRIAKIPQYVRISPDLSHMIKTDIKVRMGRPRYHEIKEADIVAWNHNQYLDRAHRNLKVFNWLHSLKELEYKVTTPPGDIEDFPPSEDERLKDEHVLAVDDVRIKPLFERLKTNYICFY